MATKKKAATKKAATKKKAAPKSTRKKKRTGLAATYAERAKAHGTTVADEEDQSEFERGQ